MGSKVTVQQLIDHFGSVKNMAHLLGVTVQCIYNWRRRGGFSEKASLRIEIITQGKYKGHDLARQTVEKKKCS